MRPRLPPSLCLFLAAAGLAELCVGGRCVRAGQAPPGGQEAVVGGVYVAPDGVLLYREKSASTELARIRALAGQTPATQPAQQLHFVSLPRLLARVRQCVESGQPVPETLQFLEGLTQVRYILAYPQERDLFIGGPAEPWERGNNTQPRGSRTGRPLLQLDDLVVALRLAGTRGKIAPFGCSIDPSPDSIQRAQEVLRQFDYRASRQLAAAIAEAIGPQRISFFGIPSETRAAMICVAADYRLKRYSIGLDPVPVAGVGNSIDNSRVAANRFWFETLYLPMLVSEDGNTFELRGQRLQVQAGAVSFVPGGATGKATDFARRFTEKLPSIAAAVPIFAELQNLADLALLAALIHHEGLAQRTGWDCSWLRDPSGYRVTSFPVAQSTPTLAHLTSGSVAAGGVRLTFDAWLEPASRQVDQTGTLRTVRQQCTALLLSGYQSRPPWTVQKP